MSATKRREELIAAVLNEAVPSPRTRRWLATGAGRREMESYRKVLNMLNTLYADSAVRKLEPAAYYSAVRTPVGRLFVAATRAGVVKVSFASSETAFIASLQRLKLTMIKSADRIATVAAQLDAYFAGERRTFEIPIDLRLATPFQRRVLEAARAVPAGQVVSYRELARRIGRPTASRAVGQALGHNPVPIVIHCHRIVTSAGMLGGYIGGLAVKKKLLHLEGVSTA